MPGYRNYLSYFLAIELTFAEPEEGENDTDAHIWAAAFDAEAVV